MYHSFVPPALRYIDQVARSGSIQGAARELNVAASAISRHLLQLEAELGVQLFDRLPRGMQLTVAGDTIVTLTRRWRADEGRTIGEIRQTQGVNQGLVQLAAMDSHATSFLPTLIDRLASVHRLVSLSVELCGTDEAVSALVTGKADLAAVFNLPHRRELLVLWHADLPLGCVVAPGHPLAGQKSTSFQEALAFPVALQSKSLAIRRYLEARHSWLFARPVGSLETNSLQLVKQLVLSGKHVAFTSELDAAPELLEGSLRFVPVRDKGADPQTISVVVDGSRPLGPIVKLVADQLCIAVQDCLASVRKLRARRAGGLQVKKAR